MYPTDARMYRTLGRAGLRRPRVPIGLVLLGLAAVAGNAAALAAEGPDEDYIRPRAVAISVQYNIDGDWKPYSKGLGTGFLVHPEGYVLTAKHVAPEEMIKEPGQRGRLKVSGRIGDRSSPEMPLDIIDVHPSRDAMLLRFGRGSDPEPLNFFALTNRFTLPIVQVSAAGFPASEDGKMKVVTEFMRSGLGEGVQVGQVNARLPGGFSGAPILWGREVVGLVEQSSAVQDRDSFDFVPIRAIRDWLSGHITLDGYAFLRNYGDWSLVSPPWGFFHAVRADPRDPKVVFAGLDQGQGIFRSRDGGRSWEPTNAGLGNREVRGIAASSFDEQLYAATEGGLWVSRDRGTTWTEASGYHGKSLLSVALSPHESGFLLAGCQRPGGISIGVGSAASSGGDALGTRAGTGGAGLKLSRDGGRTWTTFPNPENINGIWIDPEDSRVFVIAGADDGVFFTRDGLEKLRRLAAFPSGQKPLCAVTVPGGDPRRLRVGTAHGGLYWSDDEGETWARAEGIPEVQVSDIEPWPGSPSRLAAATTAGVFESDDGGKHWRLESKGLAYPWCMTLAPLADGSLIVGTSGGGAYRRAPGQSTWNPSSQGLPPAVAISLVEADGWVLAGSSVGLFKSPDGGDSWRFSGLAGQGIFAIALAPEANAAPPPPPPSGGLLVSRPGQGAPRAAPLRDNGPSEIVVGTNRGKLFRSRDAGACWDPLPTPSRDDFRQIRSINISRGTPRRVGVVVEDQGYYLSDDDGRTWSADASEPVGKAINLVVAAPRDDRNIFALTVDRGVFRSSDAGSTWARSDGLPAEEIVTAIEWPHRSDTGVVFAATIRGAVYRSGDGGRRFSRVGQVPQLASASNPDKLRWAALGFLPGTESPARMILGSSIGAFLSPDGGKTWSPLPVGILMNNYSVNDLHIDLKGRVMMATDKGIFSRPFGP